MENTQLIMGIMYGSFSGWIALSHIQQGKKIVMLQSTQDNLNHKIDNLTLLVEKLNTRFDIFMNREIEELKRIAEAR